MSKKEVKKPLLNLRYIVLCVVVLVFAVYSVVTLVNIYSQISEKKSELKELQGEITVQEIKNEEMNDLYNSSDEEFSQYVEDIAREDLDYIRQGERVFVNISGD
ncbi:MAG: septum formation initiator family protein [Ruminococcus sp.]|nr:septum formation initiator family protein [Ruminococcus sp.]MBQ7133372.1 septum formation initiator family protein [Ruminococcus sp.]